MDDLINWLEDNFALKANKFSHNAWIVTIKNSIMQTLPFIPLGSLFYVGTVIEGFVTLPLSLWTPYEWTMEMISVLTSFLIPFNSCKKKRLRKQRIIAGATGLILFFTSVTPELVEAGESGFGSSTLGAGGMFCAMFTGIVTGIIFNLFGKFSFSKEDSAVPDFVRQWFGVLLPVGGIIFTRSIVIRTLNIDLYAIITSFFMPLQGIMGTWYGFILVCFLECSIYSMDISSWVLVPAISPVKLRSIAANIALVTTGTASMANLNMYTESCVYTCHLWIGGVAYTMSLVTFLALSKSRKPKSLDRACIRPTIFNINEPVVFGCIAWSPVMMLPVWINGIMLPALVWITCKVIAIAPIPKIQSEMWYCPFPISTWITSEGSIIAIAVMLIIFVVGGTIWYPFFKTYEEQYIDEETATEAAAE